VPWPVYTVRIAYIKGGAASSVTYTVPEEMRLIVKWVGAVNGSVIGAPLALVVHGVYCWNHTFQAASASASEDLHAVAMANETVVLQTFAADIHAMVTGFLFADPAGAGGDPSAAQVVELGEWEAPPLESNGTS